VAASPGFAKTKKASHHATKANPVCPVCKMTLKSKKEGDFTVKEKVGKKTFYCCNKCDMSSLKKDAGKAKTGKKGKK
jgi:hypothetical protein